MFAENVISLVFMILFIYFCSPFHQTYLCFSFFQHCLNLIDSGTTLLTAHLWQDKKNRHLLISHQLTCTVFMQLRTMGTDPFMFYVSQWTHMFGLCKAKCFLARWTEAVWFTSASSGSGGIKCCRGDTCDCVTRIWRINIEPKTSLFAIF